MTHESMRWLKVPFDFSWLLGHSYIIIGTSNAEGRIVADKYKLLPPSGSYRAVVNGVEQSITICDNEIYTDRPSEKVIIEL